MPTIAPKVEEGRSDDRVRGDDDMHLARLHYQREIGLVRSEMATILKGIVWCHSSFKRLWREIIK